MKHDLDLFEDRKNDWLAKEIRRENFLGSGLDLDDAKRLKMEHYKKHEGKQKKQEDLKQSSNVFMWFVIGFFIFFILMAFRFILRLFMFY